MFCWDGWKTMQDGLNGPSDGDSMAAQDSKPVSRLGNDSSCLSAIVNN